MERICKFICSDSIKSKGPKHIAKLFLNSYEEEWRKIVSLFPLLALGKTLKRMLACSTDTKLHVHGFYGMPNLAITDQCPRSIWYHPLALLGIEDMIEISTFNLLYSTLRTLFHFSFIF